MDTRETGSAKAEKRAKACFEKRREIDQLVGLYASKSSQNISESNILQRCWSARALCAGTGSTRGEHRHLLVINERPGTRHDYVGRHAGTATKSIVAIALQPQANLRSSSVYRYRLYRYQTISSTAWQRRFSPASDWKSVSHQSPTWTKAEALSGVQYLRFVARPGQ
jgi:hypothetical protein